MGIIRLLLAIAVFNSHFPFLEMPVVDGHEAVLAFFAISGFYMALILDGAYATRRDFYLGRLVSLYPMYVFALCVSIALVVTADIHPMTTRVQLRTLITDPLAFVIMAWTSACTLGQELLFSMTQSAHGAIYFTSDSLHAIWSHAPLIHAWSLSLEVYFYAMAPFLVVISNRSLIALIAGSLLLKIGVLASPFADVVFFKRFFPCEFWLFGSGVLAYRLHCLLPEKSEVKDHVAFVLLIGLIFFAGEVGRTFKPFVLPAACLATLPFIFRGFKSFQFDRMIGKISYPFYLLHFTGIAVFETYWDEPNGWQILAFTLAAASLTHFIFNPGIELLKIKIRTPKHPTIVPEKASPAIVKP